LTAGGHIGAADSGGSTVLHEVARYESRSDAILLVSGGSKALHIHRSGRIDLSIALFKQNATITDYLVEEWIGQGSFGNDNKLIYKSFESG
jgi:hypothetical protein